MTKTKKTNKKTVKSVSDLKSVIAKSTDGSIQISFTLPWEKVKKSRLKATEKLGKDVAVPGFRKGNAPIEKITENIPSDQLIQETVSEFLPDFIADILRKHKIKPAMYPRFEILKATENEDWQVRATTCEVPDFELGDYKKLISGAGKAKSIWTPEKGKPTEEEKKEPTQEEKDYEVIKILLDNIKIKLPKILTDQEVNSRLSQLLQRIEKLGLTLDSYLKSIGKSADDLRAEYEKQSKDTISLEIILNKIADEEKVTVPEELIEQNIKKAKQGVKKQDSASTQEQRRLIKSVLTRRTVLDKLSSYTN